MISVTHEALVSRLAEGLGQTFRPIMQFEDDPHSGRWVSVNSGRLYNSLRPEDLLPKEAGPEDPPPPPAPFSRVAPERDSVEINIRQTPVVGFSNARDILDIVFKHDNQKVSIPSSAWEVYRICRSDFTRLEEAPKNQNPNWVDPTAGLTCVELPGRFNRERLSLDDLSDVIGHFNNRTASGAESEPVRFSRGHKAFKDPDFLRLLWALVYGDGIIRGRRGSGSEPIPVKWVACIILMLVASLLVIVLALVQAEPGLDLSKNKSLETIIPMVLTGILPVIFEDPFLLESDPDSGSRMILEAIPILALQALSYTFFVRRDPGMGLAAIAAGVLGIFKMLRLLFFSRDRTKFDLKKVIYGRRSFRRLPIRLPIPIGTGRAYKLGLMCPKSENSAVQYKSDIELNIERQSFPSFQNHSERLVNLKVTLSGEGRDRSSAIIVVDLPEGPG